MTGLASHGCYKFGQLLAVVSLDSRAKAGSFRVRLTGDLLGVRALPIYIVGAEILLFPIKLLDLACRA